MAGSRHGRHDRSLRGVSRPAAGWTARSEALDGIDGLHWQHARAADTPAAYLDYVRQHPSGRFRDEARAHYAAFRAPVPGAAYAGTTVTGAPVRVVVDADGTAVVRLDFGLAADQPGADPPPVAATDCYTVPSLSLRGPGPIGDGDRTFSVSQHGTMDFASGAGALAAEAVARGSFSEGQATGTLELRFVDQPLCDARPIAWTASAP